MRPLSLPLAGWPVILLCGIYLLAGLFGHDPWKTADAVHLGVAWEFASGGRWLLPRIGLDPWFGAPPLYHWCAALLGQGLSWLLPFHEGARMASALFGGLLLFGVAAAARALQGKNFPAWGAPLLLIGTLGLLVPIHNAEPTVALLAAQAFLLLGVAKIPGQPVAGGLIAGLACGAGFWAMGAFALPFGLGMLVLPLCHPRWRDKAALRGLAIALLIGIGLCGLWPALLQIGSPVSLAPWWKTEMARFAVHSPNWENLRGHLELLGWAAWPIFPLGLWAIWTQQRHLTEPQVLVPLFGCTIALLQIVIFSDPQPLHHLLLVVPLALLAFSGMERLRRGAANALDWFGMMTFTLLAGLIWLGGYAMASGEPARIARNFTKMEPGFIGQWSIPAFVLAFVLTLAWAWLLLRLPRSPWRGVTHWAAGMTLMWGLLMALWLPWMNYGKTYRPLALSLQNALGPDYTCVVTRNLGDAQKASLRYFIDLRLGSRRACPWLLVQGHARSEVVPAGWNKVWESNRPGDKIEKFRLYQRRR